MLLQAVAFWTTAAEHSCISEKLCKSASVPKRNKMWVGIAHEISMHKKKKKERKQKENALLKMSTFDCLCNVKMRNKFSGKLTI